MSSVPTEILLESFKFLNREELASISTVNSRFRQIVSQHLPKTPLRPYASLSLGPANENMSLENPAYRGGKNVVLPEGGFLLWSVHRSFNLK
uniref:F-box domain-containing protein n=1 Tax=Ditylenchus dipsaci TaxID=166011 RepID=A0A915DT00_9BILA